MLDSSNPIAFLPSTDLNRSRVFFTELLGLPLVDESAYVCVFRCAGSMLRVTLVEELVPQPFTVFGWEVKDIRQALANLAQTGVIATRYEAMDQDPSGVWTTPSGDLVAWFKDPDGNTLSLTQFMN